MGVRVLAFSGTRYSLRYRFMAISTPNPGEVSPEKSSGHPREADAQMAGADLHSLQSDAGNHHLPHLRDRGISAVMGVPSGTLSSVFHFRLLNGGATSNDVRKPVGWALRDRFVNSPIHGGHRSRAFGDVAPSSHSLSCRAPLPWNFGGGTARRAPSHRVLPLHGPWRGVLGGAFNALVAPLLFTHVWEYPLVFVLACFFRLPFQSRIRTFSIQKYFPWAIAGWILAGIALVDHYHIYSDKLRALLVFTGPALLCYSLISRPKLFLTGLGALFFSGLFYSSNRGTTLLATRNYFGVLRVTRSPNGRFIQLVHGNTLHGRQSVDPAMKKEVVGYYRAKGPVGEALELQSKRFPQKNVGVIGLGTGGLSCYAKPHDSWDFYEIDPEVKEIALHSGYFTYLRDCPPSLPRIILGDARLQLASAPKGRYQALIVDAFSSDSIPRHLLTREAIELYFEKLAPGGLLILHISNRYLDLAPILGNLARELHLAGGCLSDDLPNEEAAKGNIASTWAVIARHEKDIEALDWETLPTTNRPAWTDDYSSILDALDLGIGE